MNGVDASILLRLKSLGYKLVGYYDSQDLTRTYRCVVMGYNNVLTFPYCVYYADPNTGRFRKGDSYGPEDAQAHHDALNEFCDRCHKLHP